MHPVIPVLTPAEMARLDASAPEPTEVLIERAGAALARAALDLLGGAYGRRVVVVAGRGNNGADGRAAARRLIRRGARVAVLGPDLDAVPPDVDLLIDAAFGTGFRGTFNPPAVPAGLPVLAADLPSGLDGTTGEPAGAPWRADLTVTFAALKPGLVLGAGPALSGRVEVADIGLVCEPARCHVVEVTDLAAWIPPRPSDAHKWGAACWIVGGSAGMTGAPVLAAAAAFRGGASYVRVSTPGSSVAGAPLEAVGVALPLVGWDRVVLGSSERVRSVVVGPGLGRDDGTAASVKGLVTSALVPIVIDGDALWAVAPLDGRMADAPRILTPHDGEYAQLTGHPVGADRVGAARELAARRAAVVVLKGPTTVVAAPSGAVRMVRTGDQRLATAGTGDVLSGIIGAFLARGASPFDAAAAAAAVHGLAARQLGSEGLVASDLPAALATVLSEVAEPVR